MKKIAIILLLSLLAFSLYRKSQAPEAGLETQSESTVSESKQTVTKLPYVYKVEKGEGLWHIAAKEMGAGEKWVELAEANNIKKPYVLVVGQEIKIPGKEREVVTEDATQRSYTMAQVSEHDSKDSCWFAIEGKVYDVTPYIATGFHPGKAAILLGCGKDATVLFNTRPMGSGTAHSERARKSLPKYEIGVLID